MIGPFVRVRAPLNIREVGRLAAERLEAAAKDYRAARTDFGCRRNFTLLRQANHHARVVEHLAFAIAHLKELL